MLNDFSWKVGGQQGEGIDSTGEIFAGSLFKLGYHLFGYRHFSSRIKGGHTNNKIRISTNKVRSVSDDLHILVAFDQETIDLNAHELVENGVVIADSKFNPTLPEGLDSTIQLLPVPFTQIASDSGTALMKNMAAVGASASILKLDVDMFKPIIEEKFGRKGEKVVNSNMEVIQKGYDYLVDNYPQIKGDFELEKTEPKERLFLIGNEAIAFGALTAGARLMPAYPITPASEIMEYLIDKLPELGGTVIQTEDEIAAVTMAIGANYAGVRSLTASAGPGLSLMMEAIGLSGITEIPLVVVDTQRGGPSTGLPTKQEQSDLNAAIYGTHGDIPKVVLAPSTIEECFYDAIEAFNIAEKYQCPVIILSDLILSLGKQTSETFDFDKINIDRGNLVTTDQDEDGQFKRYELMEDGISPRPIPGVKNALFHTTGVEHSEIGRPSEDPVNRELQMNKRMSKLSSFEMDNALTVNSNHDAADLLIVGFGSTLGPIEEAKLLLESEGVSVNHVHVRQLFPFPKNTFHHEFNKAKKVVVVENNAGSQLADLIKKNVDEPNKVHSLLKYDGNPIKPNELYQLCKERF